jgi:hypothetical protein
MSRGEKGTACLNGLLLSIMVGCSIFSSWHFMKKRSGQLNGWLLLKNEEGKEGQGSNIGDHKVYSIDGQQVTTLSPAGGNQMQRAGVTLLLQGGCSGCLKKQYWELFVVAMEDGYEQTLFQGRGKTMHRRRRNDRLISHESEEKGITL